MANSMQENVLEHMKMGYSITPAIAATEYKCYCLPAVIKKLKNKGHNIKDAAITSSGTKKYWIEG